MALDTILIYIILHAFRQMVILLFTVSASPALTLSILGVDVTMSLPKYPCVTGRNTEVRADIDDYLIDFSLYWLLDRAFSI